MSEINYRNKGVIATGFGEISLFDNWTNDPNHNPNLIALASNGSPIGVVLGQLTQNGITSIMVGENGGETYYLDADPTIVRFVDYDPGQRVSKDVSAYSGSGLNDSSITISNNGNQNLTQPTNTAFSSGIKSIGNSIKSMAKSKNLLYAGLGLAALIILMIALKHKNGK